MKLIFVCPLKRASFFSGHDEKHEPMSSNSKDPEIRLTTTVTGSG
jgi:hypothetical protein